MAKIFLKTGKVENLITQQNLHAKFMAVFWLNGVKIVGYFDDGADDMGAYFGGDGDTLRVAYVREGAINRLISVSQLCAAGSGSLIDRPKAAIERKLGTENMLKFYLFVGLLLIILAGAMLAVRDHNSSLFCLPLFFGVNFLSEAWQMRKFIKAAKENTR